jgi:hypothetical protein
VKLIAEPMRLRLWLERGERVATRKAALERAHFEFPDEREAIEMALSVLKRLHRSPRAPIAESIALQLRQSGELAKHLSDAADRAGCVDVRLRGGDDLIAAEETRAIQESLRSKFGTCDLVPLADWRARTIPFTHVQSLLVIRPGGIDAEILAQLAKLDGRDSVPGIFHSPLMILPTMNAERGMLRSAQCETTDPVSFALAKGNVVARFPELAGWSASDSARRAVAEHGAWLLADNWISPPHGWVGVKCRSSDVRARTLGSLFSAARAALFLESIVEGAPELALTWAAVAESLGARDIRCRHVVESALDDLYSAGNDEHRESTAVAPLLEVVRGLPGYAGSNAFAAVTQ